MNIKNKLSIIIPVYNLENYISKCLNSIVRQIKDNVEIIIINDGSTDKSEEVCNQYREKYDYIKYFYQENAGVSAARNFGLKQANGEYVLFVDGDDWLLDNSINSILDELNKGYDLILGDFIKSFGQEVPQRVKNKKMLLKQAINSMEYPDNFINLFKYRICNLSLWCNVIRKKLFENNNISFNECAKYTEDMDCMLELLLSTKKIKVLLDPIYVYRQDRQDAATSKFTVKRVKDTLNFVTKWYNELKDLKLEKELKTYILNFIRYQYFIVLGMAYLLPKKEIKNIMPKLKEYEFLFKDAYGKKEKIVKIIYKIFGFNMTCILLGVWIKNKDKICSKWS